MITRRLNLVSRGANSQLQSRCLAVPSPRPFSHDVRSSNPLTRRLKELPRCTNHKRFYSQSALTQLPFLKVSDEVRDAVATNRPVVALESTIYTHGFPFPENVALALDLEAIVRKGNAVPATIGVVNGVATVGLSKEELILLASSAGKPETMKVSRRDIPYILGMGLAGGSARKLNGGTTVAATMYFAERSGIKIFGTGGLGGVHRGGQDSMDVSADLTELGRTSMAVVASGCKSFLDIPRTLEYLETQGVTVATMAHGRTGEINFPAFYTVDSGVRSPFVIREAEEASAMIYAQELLGPSFQSGIILANPIPEKFAIPKLEIDAAIEHAVQEAASKGIHGHANTPFILARIKELTKGNSIPANRALIESNVAQAAIIAVGLSRLRNEYSVKPSSVYLGNSGSSPVAPVTQTINNGLFKKESAVVADEISAVCGTQSLQEFEPDLIVVGSIAVDLSCDYSPQKEGSLSSSTDISPQMHTSNIASIAPSVGGVGHNVALAAHRAGGELKVRLSSYVADDLAGKSLLSAIRKEGLDEAGVKVLPVEDTGDGFGRQNRTAQYVSVNDTKKDLVLAMADMSIFGTRVYDIEPNPKASNNSRWAVVDANWHPSKILDLLQTAKAQFNVAYEPVSTPKSTNIFKRSKDSSTALTVFPNHIIDLATPNHHELAAMYTAAKENEHFESQSWWQVIDSLGIPSTGARDRFVDITDHKLTDDGVPLQTVQLLPFIPTILTKVGSRGVLLTELLKPDDPRLTDPASAPFILSRCANGSDEVGGVYMRLFPPPKMVVDKVVSVNGMGDTFIGVIMAGLAKGLSIDKQLIDLAQKGAAMTMLSSEAVSPTLGSLAKELDRLVLRKQVR